jgi:hypothetical protein
MYRTWNVFRKNDSRKNFWHTFLSLPFIHTCIESNCFLYKFVIPDVFVQHS